MFDKVVELLKPILQSIQEAQERNSRRNARLDAASRIFVIFISQTSASTPTTKLAQASVEAVKLLEDEIDKLD